MSRWGLSGLLAARDGAITGHFKQGQTIEYFFIVYILCKAGANTCFLPTFYFLPLFDRTVWVAGSNHIVLLPENVIW